MCFSAPYLSLEGHQLHVQLAEERVGGGGAAGHGHHVLLGEVHALWGAAAGALVVSMLQRLVLATTQRHFGARRGRFHLVLKGTDRSGMNTVHSTTEKCAQT